MRGIIFDPSRLKVQQELRGEATRRGAESILDTRMMELASPIAKSRAELAGLGWASAGQNQPDELRASAATRGDTS